MSILAFFRIIWARRWIILAATVGSVVLAVVVVEVVPPRYKAECRVMLDIIKPDPVTGQVMSSPFLRAFVTTQTQIIKDFDVANRVVADLGWANDPRIQKEYRDRKSSDDRDFQRWAAQRVIDGTDANVIEGSNIIEISYKSDRAEEAKAVADALRNAYIVAGLEDRRSGARRNANWYDQQADKAKSDLVAAENEKGLYEKANGIVLQDDKTDIDTARLAALAGQSGSPIVAAPSQSSSGGAMQLAQLDADIAQASKSLGPNNPQLIEMKHKRELMQTEVERERAQMSAAEGLSLSASRASASMLEAQKSKVLGQRDKVEHLRLLQDSVNLHRDQYTKAAERAAELRQEAEVAETGVTPMGSAVTPQSPVFPNKPLIVAGGLVGGAGLGVVLAILLEFFGRRVRSVEDLEDAVSAPVLAIIRPTLNPKAPRQAKAKGKGRPGRSAQSVPKATRA